MGAKTLADRLRDSGWFEAADIVEKQAAEFAAPQPDPAALTDEEMKDAMSKASVIVFDPKLWDLLIYAARAVERASRTKSRVE